jgi:hypothetical protein
MLDFAFDNFSAAKVDIFFQTAKSFSHFFSIWHKLFVFAAIFFEENKKVGARCYHSDGPPCKLQTTKNRLSDEQ